MIADTWLFGKWASVFCSEKAMVMVMMRPLLLLVFSWTGRWMEDRFV